MEERPRTPSIVPLPLPACAERLASRRADPTPCGAGQDRIPRSVRLTAQGTTRAPVRSGACLYTRLRGTSSAQAFPARSRSHPKQTPFKAHPRARQRHGDLLRASSPSCRLPFSALRSTSPMRTADFCFPLLRLRALAPRELPASLRGLRLALDSWACTPNPETGGPGVSRCRIRFSEPDQVDGSASSSERSRSSCTSDTPCRSPHRIAGFRRQHRARLPRALPSPLREDKDEDPHPGMPFIDRRHPRTRVDRHRPDAVT